MRIPSTATRTSVAATTVALRGAPSRIASSPKCDPGPTFPTSWPSRFTTASPSRMRNSASPGSPSRTRSVPAGSSAACAWRAIVWRSRLVQREKSPTSVSSSASSCFWPTRSSASRPRRALAEKMPACAVPATAVAYWRRDDRAPDRGAARSRGFEVRRLALFVVHRRWVVIILAVLFLPFAAIVGGGVAEKLTVGGLEDPASESARTAELLQEQFSKAGQSDFVVLVTARDGDVDGEAVTADGLAITEELAEEAGVVQASSYWSTGSLPPLKSRNGKQALVFAAVEGDLDNKVKVAEKLTEKYTRDTDVMTTAVTGRAEIARQVSEQAEHDLQRSELLTAPIVFIALVLVFGGAIAALLPLVGRDPRGRRHAARAHDSRRAHRGLGLRAEPHDRARARPRDRLQPVRRLSVPGGAGGRSLARTSPSGGPCRPRVERSRSAPRP